MSKDDQETVQRLLFREMTQWLENVSYEEFCRAYTMGGTISHQDFCTAKVDILKQLKRLKEAESK